MRRFDLSEIHDHPICPAFIRDLVTDALQALWKFGNSYRTILPRLHWCLVASHSTQILDLCSGGGGPWLDLAGRLEQDHSFPVQIYLSDKYPNHRAFEKAGHQRDANLSGITYSVDAQHVPSELPGFRTMFSSFHHFGPNEARKILSSALEDEQGIAIFEIPQRSLRTILAVCLTPLLVLLLTPRIRPFQWSRLLWTYIFPVAPMVILIDGLISCLRAYGLDELQEMIAELEPTSTRSEYLWETGQERSGLLPVTYLIGCPIRPSPADSVTLETGALQPIDVMTN
jgi:hypothetical protein